MKNEEQKLINPENVEFFKEVFSRGKVKKNVCTISLFVGSKIINLLRIND